MYGVMRMDRVRNEEVRRTAGRQNGHPNVSGLLVSSLSLPVGGEYTL